MNWNEILFWLLKSGLFFLYSSLHAHTILSQKERSQVLSKIAKVRTAPVFGACYNLSRMELNF